MSDKADKVKQKAEEDGVVNPGGLAVSGAAAVYLALIPVSSWLSSKGLVTSLVEGTTKFIPGALATTERRIPALAALYIFVTFGASGAISAAGQAMSREEGLDDSHPRKHIHKLDGLPLRMRSAHYGLLENFAGFALAAALAQNIAPNNAQLVNLLGMHVLAKLFVYYPSYVFNLLPPVRTLAHVFATSTLINVCWRLAAGTD